MSGAYFPLSTGHCRLPRRGPSVPRRRLRGGAITCKARRPADREGDLKLNDRVVGVDTLNTGNPEDMVDIMFMKIDKVVDYIRGQEGTSVALKVEPAGGPAGETKIVVIARGKVEMKDELGLTVKQQDLKQGGSFWPKARPQTPRGWARRKPPTWRAVGCA